MALNTLNHNYGQPLVVSSLNVTGNTVLDASLTVLGSTTLVSASIGAVTAGQIQYLAGLTSDVQTQINNRLTSTQLTTALASYAALAGASFTGSISATSLTLSTTPLAVGSGGSGLSATTKGGIHIGNSTTAFTNLPVGTDTYLLTADSAQATGVKWAAAPISLPSQTGNSGYYLTTNGTIASWAAIQALPTQTSNSGKFLTTDGTNPSWATLTASSLTGGTLSSAILGNSTVYVGTTAILLNRTSASQTLTGVSIDGNAATATNGLTTGNYNSYALPLTGGIMSGILTIGNGGDQIHLHPGANGTSGRTVLLRNDGSDYYVLLADANTTPATASWNALRPLAINTTTGVLRSENSQNFYGGTNVSSGNLTISSGNINFNASNPTIYASSYITFNNGIYVNGGASLYTEVVISARGGIRNDAAASLSITGGTSGQVNFTGYITVSSDKRLKSDIVKIEDALTKVEAINGYTYVKEGRTDREMGVIAQEVLEVAPELVSENEEDGMLSVSYQNMVALLIEAIKEQSIKIEALEEQVKELKG